MADHTTPQKADDMEGALGAGTAVGAEATGTAISARGMATAAAAVATISRVVAGGPETSEWLIPTVALAIKHP